MEDTPESTTDPRREFIDGLRAVADFYDQHPDFPIDEGVTASVCVPFWKDDVVAEFARVTSMLGGERSKDVHGSYLFVTRRFGPHIVEVFTSRDRVCEQVQVGVDQVEVEEVVQPAVVRKVVKEQPRFEWRCAPILDAATRERGKANLEQARQVLADAKAGA